MSSYLNFYLKPKTQNEEQPKYLNLMSFSRNNEVYQVVNDEINPYYAGDEDKYTKILTEDMDRMLRSFRKEIDKSVDRLNILRECAKNSLEAVEEYMSWKEYVTDNENAYSTLSFIRMIVNDINNDYTDFEGIYCQID